MYIYTFIHVSKKHKTRLLLQWLSATSGLVIMEIRGKYKAFVARMTPLDIEEGFIQGLFTRITQTDIKYMVAILLSKLGQLTMRLAFPSHISLVKPTAILNPN